MGGSTEGYFADGGDVVRSVKAKWYCIVGCTMLAWEGFLAGFNLPAHVPSCLHVVTNLSLSLRNTCIARKVAYFVNSQRLDIILS